MKLNIIITILIFASFFANNSYWQTDTSRNIFSGHYVITGNVSDSSGNLPLYAAAIIMNKRRFAYADRNGNFKLLLPIKYANKNFSISVAELGYAHATLESKNKQSTLTRVKDSSKRNYAEIRREVVKISGY